MLGKYSAAQLAKSTAALLTALVTFLGSVALIITGIAPPAWGYGLAAASAVLVRYATFLTNSAPTIAQIEANIEDVIKLVKQVRPSAISGGA